MIITKRAKAVIGAAALTGAVLMTGGAFTATGLDSNAAETHAVGGIVTQTISGVGTLESISYTYSDDTNTAVTVVNLTFTGSDGHNASVTLSGGAEPVEQSCGVITAGAATCTLLAPYEGLTGIAVEVTPV